MAGIKVFVSSTCYDFALLRPQMRQFIESLGYEAVMSDNSDVLFDPRQHIHVSCLNEIPNCDIVVFVIGSRFGEKCNLETLNIIDLDAIVDKNNKLENLIREKHISITQAEILKAIECNIPVYTFVLNGVRYDHAVYEKNKNCDIEFPHIEKQETAKYIFEFINAIRSRTSGGSIYSFDKHQDIEEVLRKQWSGYFQRFLQEQRYRESEQRRADILVEQFEDLKAAIISSMNDANQKEIARGVVRFRRLLDFLRSIGLEHPEVHTSTKNWKEMLMSVGVKNVLESESTIRGFGRPRTYFIFQDETFLECRLTTLAVEGLEADWNKFLGVEVRNREIIADALSESSRMLFASRRRVEIPIETYLEEQSEKVKQVSWW